MRQFRRLMMQQAAGGGAEYVKDGLAFWLDCREGFDGNTWTDKIGKIAFPMNDKIQDTDKAVLFNARCSTYKGILDINKDRCTLEVCVVDNTINGNRYGPFVSGTLHNLGLYYMSNGDIWTSEIGSTKKYKRNIINGTYSLSMNNERCLQNGAALAVYGNDYYNTYQKDTHYLGYTSFVGKIYAVRIYNRFLTEEEMLANQRADNINYKLGLPMP